jgi:outer membrane protein
VCSSDLVFILLSLFALNALAEPPAASVAPAAPVMSRIGVVDFDRIITTSITGKKLIAPLEAQLKQRQQEARALEKELGDIRAKAEKEGLTATEKQRRAWQREFEDKLQQMRQFDVEAGREMDKARTEAVVEFMRTARPEIEATGKALGFNLILRRESSSVLYADDSVDFSAQVIQRLDALAGAK